LKYYGPTTDPKDIATKEYVDTQDIATKEYVDTQIASIPSGATTFEYDVNGDVMPVPTVPTP
jgi:hypothetical protein